MISIDGSMGEGGGQVLRTCLSLSLVTGQPFSITGIRAGRRKPGLMRQHLTAVRAAAEIGAASVEGDEPGSTSLTFLPTRVRAGRYAFSIGTAGSATLVLQTLLPALLRADGPSTLEIEGGTHNPLAPPFDFLSRTFLPVLARMGARVDARLVRPGFLPAGGGKVEVAIEPAALRPLSILARGDVHARRGRVLLSHLPRRIAEAEAGVLARGLALDDVHIEHVDGSAGPGNVVLVEIESDALVEVVSAFGERGVPAERVASGAVAAARRYLASDAPVGEHLADQLLLPLALAGGGAFRTLRPSLHATTQMELVPRFLDVTCAARDVADDEVEVEVRGR